jgi:hypothetical protein
MRDILRCHVAIKVHRPQDILKTHKLKREHKLTRDRQEKQLLGKIIKSREKELSLIGKIRAEIKSDLAELFPGNGINLTSIRGIGLITAAKIVAHT